MGEQSIAKETYPSTSVCGPDLILIQRNNVKKTFMRHLQKGIS